MTEAQRQRIREAAERLQMSQGEIMRTAHAVAEIEIRSLDDLSRAEADRLIVYLEALHVAGVR